MKHVSVLSDVDALWHATQKNEPIKSPFSTFEWHKLWYDTLGQYWKPAVHITETVILPLARNNGVIEFSGGKEVSDYMDAIGPDEHKVDAWRQFYDTFVTSPNQTLTLYNVPESSPTMSFFESKGADIQKEDTTPVLALPKTWDAYLSSLSRKHRHELRRKIRKFERENDTIDIRRSNRVSDDIETLLELMRKNPKKQIFLTSEMEDFFRGITTSCDHCASLMSVLVYGEPVSTIFYFDMDKTILLYNSGFDESSHSGAGFYLKAKSIEYAIEHGYETYNFLQGSERYKYELGAKDYGVFTITLKST